ncbi:hypothetical protein evm_003380 [Chilo suppressalis]|nr:hypothetical protein evm_003380 [Chilo suppressalis]
MIGIMFTVKLFVPAAALLVCVISAKDEPTFVGEGTNVTVVEGRDATLTCKVENLHSYKVAWLRVDTQTILTIGPHVITKNHRVAVTRRDPRAWALTLRDARLADGGYYMCQINTEPMITQTHHLQVFVPPDIVDSNSSSEVMVREGDSVNLHCAASGTPHPAVTWRREDSVDMRVGSQNVSKWSGAWLNLTEVPRHMNGAFLCIATNGVPPSVSKRIRLHVLCKPTARAVHKMIGGYLGDSALLLCDVEANPTPAVYWTHIDGGRLYNGSKYQASIKSQGYKHTATLRVLDVSRDDIGSYHCHVENPLGSARDDITFYTLVTTTTTLSTTEIETTVEDITTTTTQPYVELELDGEEPEHFSDEDNYVVVLSQHQMQNLDLSPSS